MSPFLKAFAESCNVSKACRSARVHRSTVYVRRRTDAEFADAWAVAESEALDRLEQRAYEMAEAGDRDMLKFWLRNRRPEVWDRHPELPQQVDPDEPTRIEVRIFDGELLK